MSRTVCMLGHHELDYPRNRSVQRLMHAAGWQVVQCHSRVPFPRRHIDLLSQYLRVARDVDVIWVTEGGHRLVPAVAAAARLTNKPVIFDPFTSRYDTRVVDRRLHAPNSLQAKVCSWQDWSSCAAADVLVFDSDEHREYFFERYRLSAPAYVLPVGVDESVFEPAPLRDGPPPLRVLFYGTYIPLQGIEHIIEAATQLRDDDSIAFHLVGRGQEFPKIERMLAERRLANVTSQGLVEPGELVRRIADSDVCLGIFGTTPKAARVIPNKVVQCAAVGRPIVTRRSAAMLRYFRHDAEAVLVEPGSGRDLAQALVSLRDDAVRRQALARSARAIFEQAFSEQALTGRMRQILRCALERR